MGRAPHQDHIPDGKIKIIVVVLRYHGNASGGFLIGIPVQRSAVQIHRPGSRFQHPVDTFEQSGLSAAVGANHANQFPVANLQVNAPQDLAAA